MHSCKQLNDIIPLQCDLFLYILPEFSLAQFSSTAMYTNNSAIDINLIGEGYPGITQTDGGALECHTDDDTCCRGVDNPNGPGRGEWYFFNGTVVLPPGGGLFYRTRGHKVIRLNRIGHVSTIIRHDVAGIYRCEIPGEGNVTITRTIALDIYGKMLWYYCVML